MMELFKHSRHIVEESGIFNTTTSEVIILVLCVFKFTAFCTSLPSEAN
jgi:hypothetical protein